MKELEDKENASLVNLFDAVSPPLSLIGQPTLRLWIVGNPISGHGKGKEHLKDLRKAVQEHLTTCRLVSSNVTLENVHMPLWKASDFFSVVNTSTCEECCEDVPSMESGPCRNSCRGKISRILNRVFGLPNTEETCSTSFCYSTSHEDICIDRGPTQQGTKNETTFRTTSAKNRCTCGAQGYDKSKMVEWRFLDSRSLHDGNLDTSFPYCQKKISSWEEGLLPRIYPACPDQPDSQLTSGEMASNEVSGKGSPIFKEALLASSEEIAASSEVETASPEPPTSSGFDVELESHVRIDSRLPEVQWGQAQSPSSSETVTADVCGGPAIQALMVYTEVAKDGYRLFDRITQLVVQDRLNYTEQFLGTTALSSVSSLKDAIMAHQSMGCSSLLPQTMEDIPYPFRDIMVIVGGDGTLSEGINGICYGVRKGYSYWLHNQLLKPLSFHSCAVNANDCETATTGGPSISASPIKRYILELVQGPFEGGSAQDEVLQEKRAIKCLAPYVLYSPSGTGADFAKLGICCPAVDDFVSVVKEFSRAFFYSYTSSHILSTKRTLSKSSFEFSTAEEWQKVSPPGITPTSSMRCSSSSISCPKKTKNESVKERGGKETLKNLYAGNFTFIPVDVGRISFPKTCRVHYFINECSMGMSVEVIQRTNRFRRVSLLTTLGGTVIFGSASFVSLVKMAPLWVRIMRLPPRMHPDCPCCDFYCLKEREGGRKVLINPLYRHHQDMWDALDAAEQRILLENDGSNGRKQENNGEAMVSEVRVSLPKKKAIVTTAAQHVICYGNADTREELDWNDFEDVELEEKAAHHSSNPTPIDAVHHELSSNASPLADGSPFVCKEKRSMEHQCAACTPLSSSSALPRWAYLFSSTVAFGNGRWYGGGMQVTPHGDPTDHLLSVTKWRTSFWQFTSGIRGLYSGDHHSWRSTDTFDGPRFLLDAGPRDPQCDPEAVDVATSESEGQNDKNDVDRGACTMLLEADGELLEALPACIEVGPTIVMLCARRDSSDKKKQLHFGHPIPGTKRFIKQQKQQQCIFNEDAS